ncbi:EamA family transporter [Desulfobacterales bacterium HSG16]|nr:EamA family transporter [Desulfobacterales bacterium HSG16]
MKTFIQKFIKPFRGYYYIIAAACLWGMIGPLSKLAFEQGVKPSEVAFWRAMLAWIFFAIHAAAKRQVRIHRHDLPAIVMFAITGVTFFFGSYQIAVDQGGAALASVLLYTAPAWVAIMARFFFHEAITRTKLTALFLTIAGIIAVSFGSGFSGSGTNINPQAIFFGLISGFCYALYYIFGKHFQGRYDSPTIFLYILPIGALGLLPWTDFSHKTPTAWIAMGLLAILCTYCAYYLYYIGLRYLEATRASITATIEPVMASIVAYFWWGEYFTIPGYIGSALILIAVIIIVQDRTLEKRAEERYGQKT